MTTKVIQCKCVNKGQDKLHGKGKRVMNSTNKKFSDNSHDYRCTVCKEIHHQ